MGKQAHRTIIVGIIVVLTALVVGSYYSLTAAWITARSQAVRIARTQGHIERADFLHSIIASQLIIALAVMISTDLILISMS